MSFYHNSNIEIEVGDYIKINHPYRKCKYKDIVRVIDSISNSGKSVWYSDNRTNNKCVCGRCIEIRNESKVNIVIEEIKLYQKKADKEREIKLKYLLK